MSEIKLPRPIEDYLIGKYDNSVCCYLITKEAYNNWYNHKISVKITCIKNNDGLNLVEYSLSSTAKFKAWSIKDSTKEIRALIMKDYPELHKQLFEPAVKSEFDPDEYYIIYRGETRKYHIGRRNDIDTFSATATFNGPKWEKDKETWKHVIHYLKEKRDKDTWYKKFPQLSSEVKAELQKLNPERYREWEQFYMQKYPNFKPLRPQDAIDQPHCGCNICNDCLKRKPLPDPKDDYIIVAADEFGLCRRKDFTQSAATFVYLFNDGWTFTEIIKHRKQEKVLETIRDFSNCAGIRAILPKFEDYYSELEQKKAQQQVLEKQYPKIGEYYEIPMSDFEILSYKDPYFILKSDKAKLREATENCICIELETLSASWHTPYIGTYYSYTPSQKYLYVHESWYNLPRTQNELSKLWGIRLNYDEKIKQLPKATFNKPQMDKMFLGLVGEDSGSLKGLQEIFYNPQSYKIQAMSSGISKLGFFMPTYSVGIDPYQSDVGTQGVITVWSKDVTGKLVNRLTEIEGEKRYKEIFDIWKKHQRFTPQEYYNMLMNDPGQNIVFSKARRIGQTKFYEDLQEIAKYTHITTPNLKQQNNEIINVPRKVITITRGQEYSKSEVSSHRRAPAVTAEHTKYGQEPCRGKNSAGGCKIS